ncbi:MAG: hypothetical protein H0X18_19680 [Geodermatophilaceae bacterium]|nr:hypothetical protein [Geodermatophilaceae bacterium]
MNRKAAKELLHIQSWLLRVDQIVKRGKLFSGFVPAVGAIGQPMISG